MLDRLLLQYRKSSRAVLPLYYKKYTNKDGETAEISIGPCAANVLALLIVVLTVIITAVLDPDPTELIKMMHTIMRAVLAPFGS